MSYKMFNVEMIMNDELRRCRRRHQWPIFKGLFQDLQGRREKPWNMLGRITVSCFRVPE